MNGGDADDWLAALVQHWRDQAATTVLLDPDQLVSRFLIILARWRADPQRSQRLHVVGAVAGPRTGVQRFEYAAGAVTLTLHHGQPDALARALHLVADVVLLGRQAHASLNLTRALARKASRSGAWVGVIDGLVGQGHDLAQQGVDRVLSSEGFVLRDPQASGESFAIAQRGAERIQVWQRRRELDQAIARRSGVMRIACPPQPQPRNAVIVGAGLAGCAMAAELARRGWQVQLIDSGLQPAQGASGNPVASFRPHYSLDDCLLSRASRSAVDALQRSLVRTGAYRDGLAGLSGMLEVAASAKDELRLHALAHAAATIPGWEPVALDRLEAGTRAGVALRHGGIWMAQAGWARPGALCAQWIRCGGAQIELRMGVQVTDLRLEDGQWLVSGAAHAGANVEIARAAVVILANAVGVTELAAKAGGIALPHSAAPGAIGLFAPGQIPAVRCVLGGAGYLLPQVDGVIVGGAKYQHSAVDAEAFAELLAAAPEPLQPGFGTRYAQRHTTRDHFPLAGAVPQALGDSLAKGAVQQRWPRLPGLLMLCGLGSRGLIWAPWLAEFLAAQIESEPLPLASDLVAAIDPVRFARRGPDTIRV